MTEELKRRRRGVEEQEEEGCGTDAASSRERVRERATCRDFRRVTGRQACVRRSIPLQREQATPPFKSDSRAGAAAAAAMGARTSSRTRGRFVLP